MWGRRLIHSKFFSRSFIRGPKLSSCLPRPGGPFGTEEIHLRTLSEAEKISRGILNGQGDAVSLTTLIVVLGTGLSPGGRMEPSAQPLGRGRWLSWAGCLWVPIGLIF